VSTRLRLGWLPFVLAVLCSPLPVRAEPLDVELSDAVTTLASPPFWISRDGARVVFQVATEPRDVLSVPIEGGAAANLTPLGTEAPALVAVAPDGSRALMAATAPGSLPEIFSAPLIGGAATKLNHPLAPGVSAFPGPITPDSTRVIYGTHAECSFVSPSFLRCVGTIELFVAPLDGGAPTPLDVPPLPLDRPTDLRRQFLVSPDSDVGVSVMLERLPPHINEKPVPVALFRTPLAGGPATVLDQGGWFQDPFQFTSDGQRVVYNRSAELYSVSIAGGPAVKLNPPLAPPHPSFVSFSLTPDGSRVLYGARQDRRIAEVYSVPSAGGPTTKLSHPDGVYDAFPWEIAPDGERVVFSQFVAGEEALFRVSVLGGEPTRLCPPLVPSSDFDSIGPIGAIQVSSDGRFVVFAAERQPDDAFDLFSVPIEGGAVTRLGGPVTKAGPVYDFVESRFRLTADGSRVVFRADPDGDGIFELYAVPIGGGMTTKLNRPMRAGQQIATLSMEISPDGRHVVYLVRSPGTFVAELHSSRLPPEIRIDIRPRQAHNKLRPGRHVPIAVAILGSDELDVADVDLTTLAFGPSAAAAERKAKRVDIDGDGFLDLVTRYRLHDTGIARGDTEACLTGISDGFEFLSCDEIVTTGR
jgi:Tol biopolymer transport system component